MRRISTALVTVVVLAAAVPGRAQHHPPRYVLLHQELAKPGLVAQYEAAAKEFAALVKAHKDKMPHFSYECFMSPDFTYAYAMGLSDMAAIDTINAEFGALLQAAGAQFLEINQRSGAATEYYTETVVEHAPELSYRPAQTRLKPEEVQYFHYDLHYLLPGREAEADALAADYAKLLKSRNVTTPHNLYKVVIGPELPLYVVSIGAKDAADYHAEQARLQTLLGPDGRALAARAMALTRRFEQRQAVRRPDLSVLP